MQYFARPADSNRLIVVKLKENLKYRSYVSFEPVHPNVIPGSKLFKNTQ